MPITSACRPIVCIAPHRSTHIQRLAELPGTSDDEASRIVSHRPYENRRDLVRKNVLSQDEFERIRDYVYVDHEKN